MRLDRGAQTQGRERRRDIVGGSASEKLAVPLVHDAEIRAANPRGVLEHLVEHGLEFAR